MINQTQIVGKKYDVGNRIIYNTKILKSDIFDYNDAYILVRGDITIIVHAVTQIAFKNDAPFTKRITAVDGAPVDDAKDLNLIMRMHNLLDSPNYYETTGS